MGLNPDQINPLPPSVAEVIDQYHEDVAAARRRAEARLVRLPEAFELDPLFVLLRAPRATRRGRDAGPAAG